MAGSGKGGKMFDKLFDKVMGEMRSAQERVEALQRQQIESLGQWQKEFEARFHSLLDFQKQMMDSLLSAGQDIAKKASPRGSAATSATSTPPAGSGAQTVAPEPAAPAPAAKPKPVAKARRPDAAAAGKTAAKPVKPEPAAAPRKPRKKAASSPAVVPGPASE